MANISLADIDQTTLIPSRRIKVHRLNRFLKFRDGSITRVATRGQRHAFYTYLLNRGLTNLPSPKRFLC